MNQKTNLENSKPVAKPQVSTRPVTPELLKTLTTAHPKHRDDLMLAAHCVGLAIASYPDEHPLLEGNGIAVDGVTEWLLESTDELPKSTWLRIAEVLGAMFELLHKEHPHDYGFLLATITLGNPDLYDNQVRYMEEERVVDILDLGDNPTLMAAVGLSEECIDFYANQRDEVSH